MNILVVEDDPRILKSLKKGFEENGYAVQAAPDGEAARHEMSTASFDLVVLDLALPKIGGLDLLKGWRSGGNQTPVLCLTARDQISDRVKGLDAGADDYLVKPFSFDELLARCRALLRRGGAPREAVLQYANIAMDLVKRSVTRGRRSVELTAKEFSILELFLRRPEQALSRIVMSEHVWGADFAEYSNVIDVHIKNLRRKLCERGEPELLHAVRGVGYVLRRS